MITGPDDLFRDPALRGLKEAERRHGVPIRRFGSTVIPRGESGSRQPFGLGRKAEIIMILPRPGGVLFHGKAFYPPGLLRLPSGGLAPREPVLRAARRELLEETGLRLEPERFLFHLIQRAQYGLLERRFHSLGFLFPYSEGPIEPGDPTEQITVLRAVGWEEIAGIARGLETLEPPWSAWGLFRAAPHRLLLEIRRNRPDWFQG